MFSMSLSICLFYLGQFFWGVETMGYVGKGFLSYFENYKFPWILGVLQACKPLVFGWSLTFQLNHYIHLFMHTGHKTGYD